MPVSACGFDVASRCVPVLGGQDHEPTQVSVCRICRRRFSSVSGSGDFARHARTQDGDELAEGPARPSGQRGANCASDHDRYRQAPAGEGLCRRRNGQAVRGFRRRIERRRGHVSLGRILLGEAVTCIQLLCRRAVRIYRRRDGGVDSFRRRSGAVGRTERQVQHQAAAVDQHRRADGRLVHKGSEGPGKLCRA